VPPGAEEGRSSAENPHDWSPKGKARAGEKKRPELAEARLAPGGEKTPPLSEKTNFEKKGMSLVGTADRKRHCDEGAGRLEKPSQRKGVTEHFLLMDKSRYVTNGGKGRPARDTSRTRGCPKKTNKGRWGARSPPKKKQETPQKKGKNPPTGTRGERSYPKKKKGAELVLRKKTPPPTKAAFDIKGGGSGPRPHEAKNLWEGKAESGKGGGLLPNKKNRKAATREKKFRKYSEERDRSDQQTKMAARPRRGLPARDPSLNQFTDGGGAPLSGGRAICRTVLAGKKQGRPFYRSASQLIRKAT